jgi:CBS domain containing-hemolysin-like protein
LGNNKSTVTGRYIFLVGIGSFFLAIVFTFLSETITSRLNSIILSTLFLIVIIIINAVADLLGTSVTAASHTPFNAKSAKKVKGAPQGLRLIRNADKVANIANDVVGDITTTVGGALGISIVIQIMNLGPGFNQFWLNVLITALIASLIVSTKAIGKKIALSHPDDVIFAAGKLLAGIEDITGRSSLKKRRSPRNKKGG